MYSQISRPLGTNFQASAAYDKVKLQFAKLLVVEHTGKVEHSWPLEVTVDTVAEIARDSFMEGKSKKAYYVGFSLVGVWYSS